MQYHQQIKHPLWQKKRLETLEFYEFKCENCGAKDEELHVHHPFYKRGALIWDYDVDELNCLCHKCHTNYHALDEEIKKALALIPYSLKMQVLGYINAFIGPFFREDSNYVRGYVDGIRTDDNYIYDTMRKRYKA
jgi:hypothetical protein